MPAICTYPHIQIVKNSLILSQYPLKTIDLSIIAYYNIRDGAARPARPANIPRTGLIRRIGMIITQKKPIEELLGMLNGVKTVGLVGCGSCATACATGG